MDWPAIATAWRATSNNIVVVAAPNEQALADLADRAAEEGIVRTVVREPDYDDTITAVALQPGPEARRLCANYPLTGKETAHA